MRHTAKKFGVKIKEAADAFQSNVREVLFFDTREFALYKNHFIVRLRTHYKGGWPQGIPELTVKFRYPDFAEAAAVDVRPATPGGAAKIKFAGPAGAIAAAVGLVVPGAVILYARFHNHPDVVAALAGIAAAAVGLLLQVTLKIGAKQFLEPRALFFILLTFVLVGLCHVSLPVVLFLVAPIAILLHRPTKETAT